MTTSSNKKKIWSTGRIIAVTLVVVVFGGGFLLYQNFNRLLSDALMKTFNTHIISDVYELKFRNLRVNVFEGSIRVMDVAIQPREKPLREYPYINSSFLLKADELNLEDVAIFGLLRSSTLNLETISITRPEIDLAMNGKNQIFIPFSDTVETVSKSKEGGKKTIDYFLLRSFKLIDANLHSTNAVKNREFRIEHLSIVLDNILIRQRPGKDSLALEHGEFSIGAFDGRMKRDVLRRLRFSEFKIGVDALAIQNTVDTLIYKFQDGHAGVRNLDIQTRDSLYHVGMKSFDLSYADRSVKMKGFKLEPNVSVEALQRKQKYQHTEMSGSVASLEVHQIDFDALMHGRKLFIEHIALDTVEFILNANLMKPRDPAKRPPFLGQVVVGIKMPLSVKEVTAKHVHLVNRERKPDSTMAEVHLIRATAKLSNITNLSAEKPLVLSADAWLAGKTHFKASLSFDYRKTQFKFEGVLDKFNLPDLNPIIEAYTPARITKGIADEVSFSGVAGDVNSTGTMKFLYHDLEVDINLKNKAKWKSSVLAFTANTALHARNPKSDKLPPRVVTFSVDRDPNKGFINLLIKSILTGLKETMFMSKENRKAYKEAKRKAQD